MPPTHLTPLQAHPEKLSPAAVGLLLTARLSSASEASLPASRQQSRASHRRWDSGLEAAEEEEEPAEQLIGAGWESAAAPAGSRVEAPTVVEALDSLGSWSVLQPAPLRGLQQQYMHNPQQAQQAQQRLPSLTARTPSATLHRLDAQQAQQAQQLQEAQQQLPSLRRRVADVEAQLAAAQERLAAAQLAAERRRRAEARVAALQAEVPRAQASIDKALARARAVLQAERAKQAAAEQQLHEAEGTAEEWRRRFLHCVREHRPRPRPKQAAVASQGRVAVWVAKSTALFRSSPRAQQAQHA